MKRKILILFVIMFVLQLYSDCMAADNSVPYNRAQENWQRGNYSAAISDYTSAIALNPNHEASYYNRGLAYSKMRNYSKAIDDFTMAIKLVPINPDAYASRGASKSLNGREQGALEDTGIAMEQYRQLGDTAGYQRAEQSYNNIRQDLRRKKLLLDEKRKKGAHSESTTN